MQQTIKHRTLMRWTDALLEQIEVRNRDGRELGPRLRQSLAALVAETGLAEVPSYGLAAMGIKTLTPESPQEALELVFGIQAILCGSDEEDDEEEAA